MVSRTKRSMQDVARGAEVAAATQMRQQEQSFTCKIDDLKAQHFAALQRTQSEQDAKLEAVRLEAPLEAQKVPNFQSSMKREMILEHT